MKEAVALIRKRSPKSKIVLGGYGTVLSDEELAPWSDYICREEGVGVHAAPSARRPLLFRSGIRWWSAGSECSAARPRAPG